MSITEKVEQINAISNTLNWIAPAVFAAFAPLVGKKVQLANGDASSGAKDAIYSVREKFRTIEPGAAVYISSRLRYSLFVNFAFRGKEIGIYVGAVDNGVLAKLERYEPRPVYKLEEILAADAELAKLRKRINEIENKFFDFFN